MTVEHVQYNSLDHNINNSKTYTINNAISMALIATARSGQVVLHLAIAHTQPKSYIIYYTVIISSHINVI